MFSHKPIVFDYRPFSCSPTVFNFTLKNLQSKLKNMLSSLILCLSLSCHHPQYSYSNVALKTEDSQSDASANGWRRFHPGWNNLCPPRL